MWGYDLEYAGDRAAEHNIKIMKRPGIPAPVADYTEVHIPGRDGNLYIDEKTVEDIEIRVEMNYMCDHREWFEHWREAKEWLMQKGPNRLRFGDDPEYFYHVKKVELSEAERVCREIGRFSAVFICNGYQYLLSGQRAYALGDVIDNPYCVTHPVYLVEGEGTCTITVNGKTFTAIVGQNVTIDTDRMISYRSDGVLVNTTVTGDYTDLYLKHGKNTLAATGGFNVQVIPGWRRL